MRRGLAALVLAALWAAAGCQRQPAAPLEQERFVEVMVALRRASQQSAGQADFDARKQAILKKAGVTEAQLRAYARFAPRNMGAVADAYDSISARLQRYHEPE